MMTTVVVGGRLDAVTRLERFEQVIRRAVGVDEGAQAAFARLVEIDPRHIATLLVRLREKPEDAGLDGETLAKIMRRTRVSPLWLMFGEGAEYLDLSAEDPELALLLARLGEEDGLRAGAFEAHASIHETKELLRLLDAGKLRSFATREGENGAKKIDWVSAFEALRRGTVHPTVAPPTTDGTSQAKQAQIVEHGGPLPKTIAIPHGRLSARSPSSTKQRKR